MSRIPRIAGWWRGREPRERSMLALMGLLLAAFAWWYGLLWPLRELREGARAHHAQAVADLATARAGIAALAMSGAVPGPAGAAAGPVPTSGSSLQGRILDSATNAGLAVGRQRAGADGSVVVEFDRVPATAFFGWLGHLALQEGLAPASLRVERSDGQLRVEAAFGGAAP